MTDHEDDHDPDRDRKVLRQDNGSGETPAPSPLDSTALTALSNLGTALANVARSSRTGRVGKTLMQFVKDGGGTWVTGPRRIAVEAGSQWALNPFAFGRGFIGFPGEGKAPVQVMASVTDPMPDPSPIIAKGLQPNEQWTIGMKCCSGVDRDVEVVCCTTTEGGKDEVIRLVGIIGDRANSKRYGDKISPIVVLERGGYKHRQQEIGWVGTPEMRIVDWQSVYGPGTEAVTPEPEPPPSTPSPANDEQPRRRRVA
jgi:hypothetical protein